MNNTLPAEIESLYFQNINGNIVPQWPYVAAVIGHRSFAKPGEVEGLPGYKRETIKETFKRELEQMAYQWKKACGASNAPFILLTSLDDGASQLAAEAALELPKELNVKVAAILPMDKELFQQTLTDKETFDNLMSRVHVSYTLPLPAPEDSPEYSAYCAKVADVNHPEETETFRQIQYKELGKFLALHSHVLFAFWDGLDYSRTSEVVHFKLEGNVNTKRLSNTLMGESVGPVVQFLIPRNNLENLKEPIAKLENPKEIAVFYWSKHDLWDDWKKSIFFPSRIQMKEDTRCKTSVTFNSEILETITRLGDMNQLLVKNMKKIQKETSRSRDYLFDAQRFADDFFDAETEMLLHYYTYTDRLSKLFKGKMQGVLRSLFYGLMTFLFCSSLLSSLWEIRQNGWGKTTLFSFVHKGQNTFCDMLFSMPGLTLFYWFSIILFIIGLFLVKYMKFHEHFYRFRAVAEALRIQIFWRIAGISGCVSGFYRSKLPETEWLHSVINSLDVFLAPPQDKNFKKTLEERLDFVSDCWVRGISIYLHAVITKGKKAPTSFNKRILLAMTFFLIILFPFIPTWMERLHTGFPLFVEISLVLYGLLLVFTPAFGIVFWHNERNRYMQMLNPYDRAIKLLKSKPEPTEACTILRQLGTETLSENESWLISMSERKIITQH